jgi:hypothetical protein
MFLTTADFNDVDYNIPHSSDSPNRVQDFINRREEEILTELLGPVLYLEFAFGLFVDPLAIPLVPIDEEDILDKWKNLRDGAEYQYTAKDYKYTGVEKFLKPYIYSEWISRTYKKVTTQGVTKAKVQNAEVVDPGPVIVKAYNEFASLVGHYYARKNTLYGFLKVNKEVDYATWDYLAYRRNIGTINTFGI